MSTLRATGPRGWMLTALPCWRQACSTSTCRSTRSAARHSGRSQWGSACWIRGLHLRLIRPPSGRALTILFLSERTLSRRGIVSALGLGLGVVLQRGRLCFAGPSLYLSLTRNWMLRRAPFRGRAIITPLFALIEPRAVPEPTFGAV